MSNRTTMRGTARRDRDLAFLLILPAGITIFLVMILPLGYALYTSLFSYRLGQEDSKSFIFFDNYVAFFKDPVAVQSLLNTVIFTVLVVVLCLSIGVGMAMVLKSLPARLANTLRAVFTIPLLISPIVVGLMWKYMYDPLFGAIPYVLSLFGSPNVGILTNSGTALIGIVLADVWRATPFVILVASAGLAVIPEEIYEAARIDGAGIARTVFSITLPLLGKVLVILTLIAGTNAFRIFDLVYTMTGGGPANSTNTLSVYTYNQAYLNSEMGFGMASATVTLLGLIILFAPLMRTWARDARS